MIAAILLAAGESRRMRRPKALLPWQGVPLVQYQVQALRDGGADDVIVVLGHAADRVQAVLAGLPVHVVVNDAYRTGKCSSIRRGVAAVPAAAEAILILGVDQPRPPWLIRRLIDEHRAYGQPITVPVHGGHRGHPVLLAALLRDEILAIAEETQGLRAVLDRHAQATHRVLFDTDLVHLDLNTPAIYEEALRRWTT